MPTLAEVRSQLGRKPQDQAYHDKQITAVPKAPVVERVAFILERCTGKRVLHIGATGPLHEALAKVAAGLIGIDRQDGVGVIGFDLDNVREESLPVLPVPDLPQVIVVGEVLEHLSNPGHFLSRLRVVYQDIPVIITVPNAHCAAGTASLLRGIENCNKDHVAWYSYRTLRTLLERAGYAIEELYWYNGPPHVSEGLIVVTR